jgi:hypothetical protein
MADQDMSQIPGPEMPNDPSTEVLQESPASDQTSPVAGDDLDAELDGLLDLDDE